MLKVFKGEIPSVKSCANRVSTIGFPQTSSLSVLTDNRKAAVSSVYVPVVLLCYSWEKELGKKLEKKKSRFGSGGACVHGAKLLPRLVFKKYREV